MIQAARHKAFDNFLVKVGIGVDSEVIHR